MEHRQGTWLLPGVGRTRYGVRLVCSWTMLGWRECSVQMLCRIERHVSLYSESLYFLLLQLVGSHWPQGCGQNWKQDGHHYPRAKRYGAHPQNRPQPTGSLDVRGGLWESIQCPVSRVHGRWMKHLFDWAKRNKSKSKSFMITSILMVIITVVEETLMASEIFKFNIWNWKCIENECFGSGSILSYEHENCLHVYGFKIARWKPIAHLWNLSF